MRRFGFVFWLLLGVLQGSAQETFCLSLPSLPPYRSFASALLVEAQTGRVLFAKNPYKPWPTASLTKMMVALIALEKIEKGHISLDTSITVSARASRIWGRQIHLRKGQRFSLAELLQAMLVTSANDAAVAVAEGVQGSVEACIRAMNAKARELGMNQTIYRTVHGLPQPKGRPGDVSSAADLALLARELLLRYPQILTWTSQHQVTLRRGRLRLPNTNHLVGQIPGVDGIKTGFHRRAGFNLAATAKREGLRLICVVLGGKNSQVRFKVGASLLEWGFSRFEPLHKAVFQP